MIEDITRVQQHNWDAIADEWSSHFDRFAVAFHPMLEWFYSEASAMPDALVLDIACGTGMPALGIAERIRPNGMVLATDISSEMLRVAAARAHAKGLQNIKFRELNAQQLLFDAHTFDVVSCAFGLMFCPDPQQVLHEVRRIVKPGGRVAISTWAPPAENSFIAAYGRALADVLELPRYDRTAPGPFRLSNSAELELMSHEAGFRDVESRKLVCVVEYESVEVYQRVSAALTPGLTARLASLSTAQQERLRELVHAATTPFMHDGKVRLVATPICLSARG